MSMKQIIIAAIVGAASINANAAVFAPWGEVRGAAGEVAQERAQAPVSAQFYRPEAPQADAPDATQVKVDIKPWYLTGGV
jgi:hypothetical protein